MEEIKIWQPTTERLWLSRLGASYITILGRIILGYGLNIITNEHLIKQGLDQNIQMTITWLE